ncbi:hypothetical protein [Burkholderia phage vB_BglM_WTB]
MNPAIDYRTYRIAQIGESAFWIMSDDYCTHVSASEEEAKAAIDGWIAGWLETYRAAGLNTATCAVALLAVGEELPSITLRDFWVSGRNKVEFFFMHASRGKFDREGNFRTDDGRWIGEAIENPSHVAWRDR